MCRQPDQAQKGFYKKNLGCFDMSEQKDPFKYLFNIDFRKYVTILAQQKSFVLVFCLSACLSSLALTYVFSEKYRAGVAIFYRPVETSLLRQKDTETFGAPAPSAPFKVIIQTLQSVVKSDVILRPVVEELGLDKKVEFYEPIWYKRWFNETKDFVKDYAGKSWMILKYGRIIEGDPTVAAISELRENVEIVTSKDSYIYLLRVKYSNPEMAARIIDTIGQVLVEWLKSQDRNIAEDKCVKLKEQLTNKEKEIGELRIELEDLLVQNKIVSVTQETNSGVQNLYTMEKDHVELEGQIKEKQKKIAELKLEIEKKSRNYIHPEDIKRMESDKLFTQVELKGLIAKKDHLQSSIQDLRKRLDEMPSLEKKVNDLRMKIDTDTREHNHLTDMYVEALEQATHVQSEIRVLHPATVPSTPVQPIKVYHVGLTAFLSFFLSVGLVYVLAFFNIRIFFKSMGVKGRQTHSPDAVQK